MLTPLTPRDLYFKEGVPPRRTHFVSTLNLVPDWGGQGTGDVSPKVTAAASRLIQRTVVDGRASYHGSRTGTGTVHPDGRSRVELPSRFRGSTPLLVPSKLRTIRLPLGTGEWVISTVDPIKRT